MKKVISKMLSVCFAGSLLINPVFANSINQLALINTTNVEESNNLENIILSVKSKFDIKSEFTEFSYRIINNETWNLVWRDKDFNKNINVQCDNDGHILSYSKYDGNKRPSPIYLKEELLDKARNFIQEITPDLSNHIEIKEITFDGIYSGTYTYVFERVENGIKMPDNTVSVSINYETGEVTRFNSNWTYGVWIPDSNISVTKDEAREKIGQNVTMNLMYMNRTEKINGKNVIKAYLVYSPDKSYVAVDAKTGEIYNSHDEYHDMDELNMSNKNLSSGIKEDALDKVELTAEEIKNIEELNGLITKEQAIYSVTSKRDILLLDDNAKAVTASLSRGYDFSNKEETNYVWNISFTDPRDASNLEIKGYRAYASATVDAKSGKILSYNSSVRSYYNEQDKKWENIEVKYSEDECKKLLEDFIKDVEPEKFLNTKLSATNAKTYILKYINEEPVYGGYSYNYVRENEGVSYSYNNIYGAVDGVTGKIYSYNTNWNDNIEFESPKGIISKKEAYDKYSQKEGFELVYEINNKHYIENNPTEDDYYDYSKLYKLNKEVRLVYRTNIKPQNISPFTGEQLDYNGLVYVEKRDKEYTDIMGFWGEDAIKLITDMGYFFSEDEFLPDKVITKEEFFDLLKLVGYYPNEKEYEDVSSITKLEAVKIIIKELGLEKVANLSEIYNSSFSDVTEEIGYVALAKGFKIVSGDSDKIFNPSKELSRIEAVSMVLNLARANIR